MTEHDLASLGGYVLGLLDPHEARTVEMHLAGCPQCRDNVAELSYTRDAMGEVPPEFFLDGPPEGGDLLLQRTLRAVRTAVPAPAPQARHTRQLQLIAAGVAILTIGASVGGVVGRTTAPDVSSAPTPSTSLAQPGVRILSGVNPSTEAAITVALTPAPGWVRVRADVQGVPTGTRCRLVVTRHDGTVEVAGSWQVSAPGQEHGTTLDGSALVAPADVASVSVITEDGELIVTALA